jgi:hypothetical protein
VTDPYFNDRMVLRMRLFWTVATRRQLERWEPLVAASVRDSWEGRETDGADVWRAAVEHHFALVAARNLLRALELDPPSTVSVDPTLRDEVTEARDLHEHWPENMPVFNVRPRPTQPRYPSGQRFAARNPEHGPYSWLSWGNKTGGRLSPNVTAPALHQLLDDVEAEVLAEDPAFSAYVPPRAPSPWHEENGEWWPKADDSSAGRAAK